MVGQITNPETRDFDGVILSFEVGFSMDESDLLHSRNEGAPYGFTGTNDSVLDRLLDTLPLMPTREDGLSAWRAYQQRIIALQPFTYLYFPDRLNGVNERLQGVLMDLRGDWINVRGWWLAPEDRR